jgi:hypothetical protein
MGIQRTAERTWIENVPGFSPAEYASSGHGAQARILQTIGEPLTYEDLICFGAFAFRANVHRQFCPSAGHPCCGYMCIEGSNRAVPWHCQTFFAAPWSAPIADRPAFEAGVRAAVKASIDRGVPVHYGSEEDGLIIGYGDDGQRWWCLCPYHEWGAKPFWHDEVKGFAGGAWPWFVVVWTGPKPAAERPSRRELTRAGLQQAVDMWHTECKGDYFCGDAAYAFWLKWLADAEAGQVANPHGARHGSGWCFDVIIHGRRIAAPWLAQAADDYPGPAGDALRLAAQHYAQVVEVCMAGLKCPWDLAPDGAEWPLPLRQQLQTRLTAAREHDRAAIAALTQFLAATAP